MKTNKITIKFWSRVEYIRIIYQGSMFLKFVDKSYNDIKSTIILIKCISFEIYTPV